MSKEMKRYRVKILEVGKDHPIITEAYGYWTEAQLIEFYGLNEADVVRYEIEEVKP